MTDISEIVRKAEEYLFFNKDIGEGIPNLNSAIRHIECLLDVVKEREWKTISTAPMDGTEIIIQDIDYDKNGNKSLGYRYVAYYDPDDYGWFDGSGTYIDVSPEFWQPLPLPPKPEAGGE